MAAAASSYSSPPDHRDSSYSGEWEYDVFLCFRGGDTRHGFTSHLMAALCDRKIKAFIDTMLRKTESIDELLSVLQRSALSIVIFSEKFADSPWCLDEVATIVQSMSKFGHRVLPVFYKVRWADVAGDSGRYSAIINGELKASSEDNEKWKDALKAVANYAGHTSSAIPMESELIKAIVEDVQKQLVDMSPSIRSESLVGMGSRVWQVEQLLSMEEADDTRIIGLWGMAGVGKTTLAKACYERVISSTKGIKHHFIRNINQICGAHHGVDGIVRDLYSKVLSESDLSRDDLDMHYRRARLSCSKVFIVLDDVDTLCQLEQLLLGEVFNITKLFAAGSRIIFTTRNKKVLQNARARTYHVACLSDDESVQLFSLRAFRERSPPDNWMDLSCRATSYCNGNPLAIRVLGGTLFDEDRDYWESVLNGLGLIQNPEIGDILRRSYNKLGSDEKRVFLDVACFLNGISRSRLVGYMAALHPSAHATVKDLIDKSLLTCIPSEDEEKIEVHGLLIELAVNIVNDEPKLGKRSRLVDPEDIHKLLTSTEMKSWSAFLVNLFYKGVEMVLPRRKRRKVIGMHRTSNRVLEGDRSTEGINLNLFKAKEMYLEANAFEGMYSLTFLKFWWPDHQRPIKKKIHLPYGGLDSLPDGLRWLEWDRYPSKSLPFSFYPQNLVHLAIRWSPIKKCWEGVDHPKLVSLVVLDLSYCFNLTALPDISCSLQLEELLLRGCKSLVEVPSHVQYLDKLIILNLGGCENLMRLPSKLNSKVIKHVRMRDCPKLKHCPEINSGELLELDLFKTPIRELPTAVNCFKLGGILSLSGKNITNFPTTSAIFQRFKLYGTAVAEMDCYDDYQASSDLLPKFDMLELEGNSLLKSLPKNIWNMVTASLIVRGSPLLESLPEISEPLISLSQLFLTECESLERLPSNINNFVFLDFLNLTSTGIKSLPSSIQELNQLLSIVLSNCKSLESIPSSIHKLPKLQKLQLGGCGRILSLPELPPSLFKLDVGGCKSLQALPSNASELSWSGLVFDNCPQLDKTVPDEIVANYSVCAQLSKHPKPTGFLHYSGSDIPEWFACKSIYDKDASCIMMQLPPANCNGSEQLIKGIAFGMVWRSDALTGRESMKCDCDIDTFTIASWSCFIFPEDALCERYESDLVSLWFDKKTKGRRGRCGEDQWYVKYAGRTVTFRFYASRLSYGGDVEQVEKFKIKRCGLSLLY
ncbi:unnamed protein product [Linum trigynum]|uniref:TIR domain-containing protein n=1 Tax=Linum trigynum TaxID=586398 RepID=A0AAV2D253_9ROSI